MDETLSCLRSKSTFEFQSQNINIPYPDSTNPPLFMWNPVIDSALVQDYTYNAFDNGLFLRIPVMFGDDTNGGTIFTPRSTSDLAQSNLFLHDQFPFLTIEQLKKIDDLYPNHGPQFPSSGAWWRQVSNAYGDLRYMCPTLFISQAFARYGVQQNWNYRYDVKDPAQMAIGLGTPHTAEIGAIWVLKTLKVPLPQATIKVEATTGSLR
jgi:carboxylesterase type B